MVYINIQLTDGDITEAIAAWVRARGLAKPGDAVVVHLDASPTCDLMDRPTGGHTVRATATVRS